MSILNLLPSIVCLTVLIFTESSNAGKGGITIDLIHRESPLSPFSNPSDTYSTRLSNSVARSRSRANHFHAASSVETNDIQSDVTPDTGAYLMKFSIGTPPVEILAIADTGSDLIWTQCDPCKKCYQQKGPIFNSQQSSTYKVLPCDSSYCQVLPKHGCGQQTRNCVYLYSYGDNYSYTTGVIANETLTFDSSNGQAVSIPNILFGCGKVNVLKGTPNSAGINSAGIVGLGGGPVSLVSQLSSEYGGKFSYCLVPLLDKQATSKLRFGNEAMISGQGVVSTPFISKDRGTYYYLTLEGVSVGNQRLDMQSAAANPGNMIIDSGTTLTYLNSDLYNAVASAVQGAIKVQSVPHPSGALPFCYNINSDLMIPEMTFHFTGADLKVGPSNTFIRAAQDLVCITLAPTKSLPIFGNLAQVNFQVEYDRQGKKVSFAAADCTKF